MQLITLVGSGAKCLLAAYRPCSKCLGKPHNDDGGYDDDDGGGGDFAGDDSHTLCMIIKKNINSTLIDKKNQAATALKSVFKTNIF